MPAGNVEAGTTESNTERNLPVTGEITIVAGVKRPATHSAVRGENREGRAGAQKSWRRGELKSRPNWRRDFLGPAQGRLRGCGDNGIVWVGGRRRGKPI